MFFLCVVQETLAWLWFLSFLEHIKALSLVSAPPEASCKYLVSQIIPAQAWLQCLGTGVGWLLPDLPDGRGSSLEPPPASRHSASAVCFLQSCSLISQLP